MTHALVRLAGISRRFGSVTALAGADLELRAGEVHGVLGANGAGKTTLLNVLGGMLRPDAGEIIVDGRAVVIGSPRQAWAHGVVLVHQHFTLVPALTVAENLALGLRSGGPRLDLAAVTSRAERLMERTGLSVPLDHLVERLGVGDRQRTEILKALLREPRVLVLDEPTAVLAPQEIEGLFDLLRTLASEGRAVALVAHKLDEVLGVADRITVLREGASVFSVATAETSAPELVRAMVGSQRADAVVVRGEPTPPGRRDAGAEVARIDDVTVRSDNGAVAVDRVTLSVRRGEIVGVAGIEGNGQHELAQVLSGRLEPERGTADLPGGIGFIPQDRSTEGVVADFDLAENVALALQHEARFVNGPLIDWRAVRAESERLRTRHRVGAPSLATRAGELSGGNQQRVVVGRELGVATDLLVAENPTRGLDVAATAFVHGELRRLTGAGGEGPGVVLVSTDLDEVLALSDRLFAMRRGRLLPVPDEQRTREGVGALMLVGERA